MLIRKKHTNDTSELYCELVANSQSQAFLRKLLLRQMTLFTNFVSIA